MAQPWEFLVSATGFSTEEVDAGVAQAAFSVGYFVSDMVEVALRQNVSYQDAGEGSSDQWNGVTRAAVDLHFPIDEFVPYVGVNAGYVYGDSFRDSFIAGPEGGIKYFLKDDAFVQFGIEYQFFFDEGDSLNTAFDEGQLLYLLGFGLRF